MLYRSGRVTSHKNMCIFSTCLSCHSSANFSCVAEESANWSAVRWYCLLSTGRQTGFQYAGIFQIQFNTVLTQSCEERVNRNISKPTLIAFIWSIFLNAKQSILDWNINKVLCVLLLLVALVFVFYFIIGFIFLEAPFVAFCKSNWQLRIFFFF